MMLAPNKPEAKSLVSVPSFDAIKHSIAREGAPCRRDETTRSVEGRLCGEAVMVGGRFPFEPWRCELHPRLHRGRGFGLVQLRNAAPASTASRTFSNGLRIEAIPVLL